MTTQDATSEASVDREAIEAEHRPDREGKKGKGPATSGKKNWRAIVDITAMDPMVRAFVPAKVLVFLALELRARKNNCCWPSDEDLSKLTGITNKGTLKYALKQVADEGLVKILHEGPLKQHRLGFVMLHRYAVNTPTARTPEDVAKAERFLLENWLARQNKRRSPWIKSPTNSGVKGLTPGGVKGLSEVPKTGVKPLTPGGVKGLTQNYEASGNKTNFFCVKKQPSHQRPREGGRSATKFGDRGRRPSRQAIGPTRPVVGKKKWILFSRGRKAHPARLIPSRTRTRRPITHTIRLGLGKGMRRLRRRTGASSGRCGSRWRPASRRG